MIKAEIEISNGGKLCLLRRGYLSEKEVNRVKLNANFEKGRFRLIISEELRKELNLEIIYNRRLLQTNKKES
ncbi:MAG: hypothetical protein MUC29_14745, partial [Pyrinomonadaceae bacterium]|nr:hypothetical protein [Pyrinomonadaceae bacterium]